MPKKNIKRIIFPILAFFVIIGLWILIDYLFNIKEIILPNPIEIAQSLVKNINLLLLNTSITSIEAVVGFLIGSVFALIVAVVFVQIPWLKDSLNPYIIAFKAAPVYAFAPLLILWFGNGILPKAVMAAIVSFFPILISTIKGLTTINQESFDMFTSLNATKWKTFLKLRIPSSLPFVFPAIKVSTTFAVVGATIAEFTGASAGIGSLISNASYYMDTSLMFAAIVMISIFGILFFFSLEWVERKVVFWQVEK